jgi:hypothetical protein
MGYAEPRNLAGNLARNLARMAHACETRIS